MTRALFAVLVGLLLCGCAQMRDVTGGEKDTVAPVLVTTDPPHLSTGFTGQRILLRFNERVKVADLRQQFLISPPLPEQPEVLVQRGTDVVIELQAPLAESTTYSFNLGTAVRDVTEANVATDVVYVVSTGDHVDSSAVSGVVLEARSGKPAGGLAVLLYPATDSTGLREGRPAYAARTDDQGRYRLDHLRNGAYRLYALRDQNANLRFDLPNEDVAFLADALTLPDSLPKVMHLFRQAAAAQGLMDQRVGPDRDWMLVMARPVTALSLRDLDRTGGYLTWTMELNAGRDTVHCWPNDTTALNGQRFELREGGAVLDTLVYRVRDRMPFYLTATLGTADGDLLLRSSRPLAAIDTGSIRLRVDSTDMAFAATVDTADRRWVRLAPARPLAGTAVVRLLPKALQDVYGGGNDTLVLSTAQARPDQLGTLELKVDPADLDATGPWLVQVVDGQERPVRTLARPDLGGTLSLGGLPPGSYGLKLVLDANGDGEQDTGDLSSRLQPERAWRFPGTLVIRAGWVVEQSWRPADP
jgi:hypothetical protein